VFLWQGMQLRDTVQASRDTVQASRDAVQAARDEFLATHRPQIRIKHLWLVNDIWQGDPIIVNLTCVNNGTGEAILGEVGIRYHVVAANRRLPIDPHISALGNFNGYRLLCGRNAEMPNINNGTILTPQQNADIQQGRSKLYCVGYVTYLDGSNRMRITGFCRVLTFPSEALAHVGNCRFLVFKDPDYEYQD
jgi:hypothetical protein